jgi:hypothetical protein
VSSRGFERWVLAAGFAVAAAYAVVAVVEVIANDNPGVAIPFAYVALSIAGPLAAVSRLLGPSRQGPDGDGSGDGDDSGPSDDGGGGEPTPPSWWPEFERAFWADVERRGASRRSPGRSPAAV